MRMRHFAAAIAMACAGVVFSSSTASAALPVQTDFSSATTGSLANNAVINSGGVNTDDFTATKGDAGNTIAIVGASAPKVLQFTNAVNNSTLNVANRANTNAAWSSVSTDATGNNMITGSVEFVRLQASKTGFRFFLGAIQDSTGGTPGAQLMVIEVQSSGTIIGRNSSPVTATNGTNAVAVNVPYRLDFTIDMSSATTDTFGFSLTNLNTSSVVATLNPIPARGGNVLPDRFVLDGRAVDSGLIDSNPSFQINSVVVNAVPEPTSLATLALGGLVALRRRRA